MNANTPLLSVVADIRDTTFDQALRNKTLKRIVEYGDAQSAGLVTRSATGEIRIAHRVGAEGLRS